MSLALLPLFQSKKMQTDVGMWKQWPLTRTAWSLPWHISVLSHHRSKSTVLKRVTLWDGDPEAPDSVAVWGSFQLQFKHLPPSPLPLMRNVSLAQSLVTSGCVLHISSWCSCYKSLLPNSFFTPPVGLMQKARGGSDGTFLLPQSPCLLYLANTFFFKDRWKRWFC